MKGNLVRQMELAAGGLLVLTALWGLVAHFHVSACLLGPPGGGLNNSWLAFGELWGPFLALGAFQEVSRAFLESSWASLGPQGRFQGRSGGCFQVLEWSLDGPCRSLGGPWVAPSTLLDSSWSV